MSGKSEESTPSHSYVLHESYTYNTVTQWLVLLCEPTIYFGCLHLTYLLTPYTRLTLKVAKLVSEATTNFISAQVDERIGLIRLGAL